MVAVQDYVSNSTQCARLHLYARPRISCSEQQWLASIETSASKYLNNQHNLDVTGPVLVITDSILKAEKVGGWRKVYELQERFPSATCHGRSGGGALGAEGIPHHAAAQGQSLVARWKLSAAERCSRLPLFHLQPWSDGKIAGCGNCRGFQQRRPRSRLEAGRSLPRRCGRALCREVEGPVASTELLRWDWCNISALNLVCCSGCSFRHPPKPNNPGGSVLFVILTEILNERQDVQARGRCGRSGKAGALDLIHPMIFSKKNGSVFPGLL